MTNNHIAIRFYLEYARHQTLSVPSDVRFYSSGTKELEVARVKDEEETALCERRRMDMEMEFERELARIRAEEKAAALSLLGSMVEKPGRIPATDYRGVRTLVTSVESKGLATGLVLGLLGKASEEASFKDDSKNGYGDEATRR